MDLAGGQPGDRRMAAWVAWEAAAVGRHYLQAVQEELHAVEVEEHLAVVGCLVCDVPQRTPGELHHLVTLKTDRKGWGSASAPPGGTHGLLTPGDGGPSYGHSPLRD